MRYFLEVLRKIEGRLSIILALSRKACQRHAQPLVARHITMEFLFPNTRNVIESLLTFAI